MSNKQIPSSLLFTITPWEKLLDLINNESYSSINIVADTNTEKYCLPLFKSKCTKEIYTTFIIPVGEKYKNLETCQTIWNHWLEKKIDRNAVVICLGGGVLCDITGFAASAVLRGVSYINIPTSLMAMADAALGGKTGINFKNFKNQIGSFIPPKAVLIEYSFLDTLSDRHLRNGFVEIIKHSLIQSPTYWNEFVDLSWPLSSSELQDHLKKSIRTKLHIVEQDFYDRNIRMSLNFGHTIGHAIESYFLNTGVDVLHGEAIAIGMICESFISNSLFKWKPNLLEQICLILKPFTGNLKIPINVYPDIVNNLVADKKKLNQHIKFSLLSQPGISKLDQVVDFELVEKSLDYYNLN